MELERFRTILLDHARRPRNSGELNPASQQGECMNPLCGDRVRVTLQVSDSHIHDLRIQVSGCTMAVASASLMGELVKGRSLAQATVFQQSFHQALCVSTAEPWPEALQSLLPLSHLRLNPTRVPCALLGWQALKCALA